MIREAIQKMDEGSMSNVIKRMKDDELYDTFYDVLDNQKAQDLFDKWTYDKGPGADDRYRPDDTSSDYLDGGKVTDTEIRDLLNQFAKKGYYKG
ncbi:MAG: hypothetical protein KAI79_06650 [Bacteroidales bacterium]|nr:hypothetical protein [Bacteroidales bacterium]